jgi:hypothetical protein
MTVKKNLKVSEIESNVVPEVEPKVVPEVVKKTKKPSKDEPKVVEPEPELEPKVLKKSKKSTKANDTKVVEPETKVPETETKVLKKTKKTSNTDETKVPETKVVKTKVPETKVVETKVVESELETKVLTKSKKSSKTDDVKPEPKLDEEVDKSKNQLKSKKESTEQIEPVHENVDFESFIKEELETTKKSWLNIIDKIQNINLDREKLEVEKNTIVKKLKDLLDKLQDDKQTKGFMLDNKVELVKTKNDIIQVESDSDSDVSDSESDSDSESEKKILLSNKLKNKSKVLIKTTKGNTKNSKLSLKDNSDSDSD